MKKNKFENIFLNEAIFKKNKVFESISGSLFYDKNYVSFAKSLELLFIIICALGLIGIIAFPSNQDLFFVEILVVFSLVTWSCIVYTILIRGE